MQRYKRIILGVTILANIMVLLGQLWPAGVPPFAPVVNILFLAGTLVYFIRQLFK